MGLLEDIAFELERRVILFKPETTMPDGTQLGFDGDPNTISSTPDTDGEFLIYNCPIGARYQESSGNQWVKIEKPNVWITFTGGLSDPEIRFFDSIEDFWDEMSSTPSGKEIAFVGGQLFIPYKQGMGQPDYWGLFKPYVFANYPWSGASIGFEYRNGDMLFSGEDFYVNLYGNSSEDPPYEDPSNWRPVIRSTFNQAVTPDLLKRNFWNNEILYCAPSFFKEGDLVLYDEQEYINLTGGFDYSLPPPQDATNWKRRQNKCIPLNLTTIERNNYSPQIGELVLDTDEKALYMWMGSYWKEI